MSAEGGGREIAYRLFAAEYDDATLSHAESDEERAPNYVVTPTGARVNRLFVVGTLTEVTEVNEEMLRARVVDPTGAFVVYAGQYQPDELAFLERTDPPVFVAVTGKARTFQPEDSDRVYTSVRPESIAVVDGDTRDRWVVEAAERTVDRIGAYAEAAGLDVSGEEVAETLIESGLEEGLARGIPLAMDHYGTTPAYLERLRELALDAARVVAGERDQVEPFDHSPDASSPGSGSFADLAASSGSSAIDAASSAATSDDEFTPEDASPSPDTAETAETPSSASGPADAALDEDDSSGGGADVASDTDESVAEPAAEPGPDDGEASAGASESDLETSDDVADPLEASSSVEEDGDELGDFEAGGFDEGMYEMDDEEREEIEAQFGAEFTTGSEVDGPDETDADELSDPDPSAAEAPATGAEPDADPAEAGDERSDVSSSDELEPDEAEPADEADDESDDVDLEEYVVETMSELDDGDGADRETVIETVVDETGADADDVEDAIQDALMGGQCYEPNDGTLKAI